MMQFSPRLLGSRVELEVDDSSADVVVHGEIIVVYEGRQWTALAHVLMLDGPYRGSVTIRPIEALVFTGVANTQED